MNYLILGSLPKTEGDLELYNSIISVFSSKGGVKSPIDTSEFKGSDSERYVRAFETVSWADLVIAEMSSPSTGQGMEIRECDILGKPLVVVAKAGSKVSGLVKGCPALKEIIYYDSLDYLKGKLKLI